MGFTVAVVLSFSSLPLFKSFQVLKMISLIDMIAWSTTLMWMDGMSESADSRLVLSFENLFVKTCVQAFFCVGLGVTWLWNRVMPSPLFQNLLMYSFGAEDTNQL